MLIIVRKYKEITLLHLKKLSVKKRKKTEKKKWLVKK